MNQHTMGSCTTTTLQWEWDSLSNPSVVRPSTGPEAPSRMNQNQSSNRA